jgi:hypothetical protein
MTRSSDSGSGPDPTATRWTDLPGNAAVFVPSWTIGNYVKGCLAVTVVLYILNQKHFLPKPLSAIVSKVLFWPTLPVTAISRLGSWSTVIDDTVLLGAAPFGFIDYPERLYTEYGVSASRVLVAETAMLLRILSKPLK